MPKATATSGHVSNRVAQYELAGPLTRPYPALHGQTLCCTALMPGAARLHTVAHARYFPPCRWAYWTQAWTTITPTSRTRSITPARSAASAAAPTARSSHGRTLTATAPGAPTSHRNHQSVTRVVTRDKVSHSGMRSLPRSQDDEDSVFWLRLDPKRGILAARCSCGGFIANGACFHRAFA